MNASVPIVVGKTPQHLKCIHCVSELAIRMLPSGAYKMRSELGLEYVVGTERNWKEKVF